MRKVDLQCCLWLGAVICTYTYTTIHCLGDIDVLGLLIFSSCQWNINYSYSLEILEEIRVFVKGKEKEQRKMTTYSYLQFIFLRNKLIIKQKDI